MDKVLLGSVMGLLLACTAAAEAPATPFFFAKSNTSFAVFRHDEIVCATASRSVYWDHGENIAPRSCPKFDASGFLSCMNGRGYSRVSNGYQTAWAWKMKAANRECDDVENGMLRWQSKHDTLSSLK